MTVSDRRREISDLLLQKGKIKVGDLARRFQVSTETIRKDLLELEAQGFIKKNKGSAEVLVETCASAYSQKSEKFIEVKKKIAREAARLVPSRSVIFMDAGSTNYQLARQLIMRKDIIVVTNFTPIAELMNANEIKVILRPGFSGNQRFSGFQRSLRGEFPGGRGQKKDDAERRRSLRAGRQQQGKDQGDREICRMERTHRPSDRRPAGQAGTEQPEKGTECDRGRYKRRGIDKDNR